MNTMLCMLGSLFLMGSCVCCVHVYMRVCELVCMSMRMGPDVLCVCVCVCVHKWLKFFNSLTLLAHTLMHASTLD